MNLTKANKGHILILVLTFIFLSKLFLTLSFNNSDWEPDSFMHFLELRTIFSDFPNNLTLGLGVWTKPLYAYPLGFFVHFFNIQDLIFVQVMNILISMLISYLVYKIVFKLFGNFKIALFSIFLCAFSLTLLKSSASTLTDQIFALMIILNAHFALNKKYVLAAFFVGLSVLGRIEGLFFVGIYGIWILFELQRSQYKKILLIWINSIFPVFIWNFLGFLHNGNVLFVIQSGYPSTPGIYGYGGYFSYLRMFLFQEFVVSVFFLFGTFYILKFRREWRNNKFLTYLWISFSGFFLIETILWKLGMFGSAGLMRYFVGVLPFMIIVAAFGVKNILLNLKTNQQILFLISATLVHLTLLIFHIGGIGFKQHFPNENEDFKAAGEWVKNNIHKDEFLYADRPETIYYAGRNLTNSANRFGSEFSARIPGIYVWSKEWGRDIYGFTVEDFKTENVLFKISNRIYVIRI